MQTSQTVTLRDKPVRWIMLLLVSLTMFAAYVAADVFSPLKTMLETHNHWNSLEYGWFSSSYSLFNVFLGMLIFGGIVLDKKGIRFCGIGSSLLMVIGIAIKYWAVSTPELLEHTFRFMGTDYKAQVAWAVFGFAIFGVGAEVAGITVSKAIVKWFRNRDMAMAMGLQLSLARLGKGAALLFAPGIAAAAGNVSRPVLIGLCLLVVGTLCFVLFALFDKKLDRELKEASAETQDKKEDSFSIKDIGAIVSNPGFWLIATLCVLFYAAVSPFTKFATDLMVNKFGVEQEWAGAIPAMIPFGCIILSPLFGRIYDRIGHGADLMIFGACLITVVHTLFSAPYVTNWAVAVILMILLGIGYALVPAAMWPSLARIMPEKQFGTAIALTYFIQNIGLWGVPVLIGYILDKYCITGYRIIDGKSVPAYDYTLPMLVFVIICALSIITALALKRLDKRRNYGLQAPNMKG